MFSQTDYCDSANRAPRMYDLYLEYFELWAGMGGTVFRQFSSLCTSSKWGSWCALENVGQDSSTAPKYRALMEMIRRYPHLPVRVAQPVPLLPPTVLPKIALVENRLKLSGGAETEWEIIGLDGSVVQRLQSGKASVLGNPLSSGIYLVPPGFD